MSWTAYVWYHGRYVRITVIYRDFAEATESSFWKIKVDHRDSDILTSNHDTKSSKFQGKNQF
jgi:hypothetical protein